MGGNITVDSMPGEGTKISVSIPLEISSAPKITNTNTTKNSAALITDNDSIFEMVATHLSIYKFSTHRVSVDSILANDPISYDLILLDYNQTENSGTAMEQLSSLSQTPTLIHLPSSPIVGTH